MNDLPVNKPVDLVAEPTGENSKTKARKHAKSIAHKKHVKKNNRCIMLKVETMTAEEARLRLPEVVTIVKDINTDLAAFSKGETNVPKMIESGLPQKAWLNRARWALKYALLERRLLLIKLQSENKEKITAEVSKETA